MYDITQAEYNIIRIWRTIRPGGEMLIKAKDQSFTVLTKNVAVLEVSELATVDMNTLLKPHSKVEFNMGQNNKSISIVNVKTDKVTLDY